MVLETLGQTVDHAETFLDFTQQKHSGVRGDGAPVEFGGDLAV